MTQPSDWVLGESEATLRSRDRNEFGAIVTALIRQARHSVALAAPRLDHPVFLSEDVSDALSHLPVAHPRNTVRFLVEDDDFFVANNTRLLALCRRFSTYVKARRIPEHRLPFSEMILVVDDAGYVHQPNVEEPLATASFNDRARCRLLLHGYDEMWERGAPIAEISTLGL